MKGKQIYCGGRFTTLDSVVSAPSLALGARGRPARPLSPSALAAGFIHGVMKVKVLTG